MKLLKVIAMLMLISIVSTCKTPSNFTISKECQYVELIFVPKNVSRELKNKIANQNINTCFRCYKYQETKTCKAIIENYNKDIKKLNK